MPRPRGRRYAAGMAPLLLALGLMFGTSSAAAVTIGQLEPDQPPDESCETSSYDLLQPEVTSGNGYVVPSTGGITSWTVTSWSTNNRGAVGETMALKMFRKVGEPDVYKVIGREGPHSLASGVNTFAANIQVQSGDVLGAHHGPGDCAFAAPGRIGFIQDSDLPVGGQGAFTLQASFRVNEAAEIVPTSSFTLGKVKAKKNGTATLQAALPNPGNLTVSGKGVKGSASAVSAKRVNAGTVKLVIRAKGKNKRKLVQNGKVTVKPKITYTPTGGTSVTQKKKVKLRRK
jgi:hypothetical protein